MLKKLLSLSSSNALVSLNGLLRNILIARLISVEDFGIASTFAVTMFFLEMSTELALNRFIVQDKSGDDPDFQATLQAVQFARGVFTGLVLLAAAGPIANLFGVPDTKWAYQVFAIVPVLRSAINFDMYRLQREMRFSPNIIVDLSSQAISTIAAIAFAFIFKDYRAMLFAIILQQASFFLASHFVAERAYRWNWDREILKKIGKFSWPLLINGFVLFLIFHGERVIIGSEIGLRDLGWFTAALTITLAPSQTVDRTLQSFLLPKLSRAQDDDAQFEAVGVSMVAAYLLMASAFAACFTLGGPLVIGLLFGAKYDPALAVVGFLGVMQGMRLMRNGPAIVALARAQTTIPLYLNLARVAFVPATWLAAVMGGDVMMIIYVGITGEVVSAILSLVLMLRAKFFPLIKLVTPLLSTVAVVVLAALCNVFSPPSGELLIPFGIFQILLLGAFAFQFAQTTAALMHLLGSGDRAKLKSR